MTSTVLIAVLTGALAGLLLGYVLQRGQLCFHSAIASAQDGLPRLARAWAVGVAVAAVGFAVLALLPGTEGLNQGLALRPVANVVGGLVIGVGMVVASSCLSGLFYKLGSGMLGATVGLAGWAVGELLASRVVVPGPTVLAGGEGATLPGVLDLPRLPVALGVLVVVLLVVRSTRRVVDAPQHPWQWDWPALGLALGAAVTAAWALAAAGGSSFGVSSVGAVAGVASGSSNPWLIAFLVALVLGSTVAARTAGGWWVRGETGRRLAQLGLGGVLIGAGGFIAGGCNLGHGLSGASQLSLSSFVVIAAMVVGVVLTRLVRHRPAPAPTTASPAAPAAAGPAAAGRAVPDGPGHGAGEPRTPTS